LRADASKTRSTASSTSSSAEKIERVIHAQSALGAPTRRSLRQLSGGERRRAAIALALAHADLALARGGVACDLLVLDEVLQHLDGEGAARVAALLRSLPRATVLLTSQADSATAHLFDVVDRVWKAKGSGGVIAGEAARRLSYGGLGGEGMTEEEEEATRVEA
jgi:ABC-type multidrug transport system ATPase subunit